MKKIWSNISKLACQLLFKIPSHPWTIIHRSHHRSSRLIWVQSFKPCQAWHLWRRRAWVIQSGGIEATSPRLVVYHSVSQTNSTKSQSLELCSSCRHTTAKIMVPLSWRRVIFKWTKNTQMLTIATRVNIAPLGMWDPTAPKSHPCQWRSPKIKTMTSEERDRRHWNNRFVDNRITNECLK